MAVRNGAAAVVFRRRTDAADRGLGYRLEASADLRAWQPVSLTGAVVAPPVGIWQELAVTTDPAVQRRFYRLVAVALADD
jgi:hypothetical protein